ncbi:MAG: hypothetical protein EKK48_27575 [Candidatus Melainabacteria bacterium]|nr:MAG: hypothetical protein EKK48_27575 [Candidatus Melainabacteria bacterium]
MDSQITNSNDAPEPLEAKPTTNIESAYSNRAGYFNAESRKRAQIMQASQTMQSEGSLPALEISNVNHDYVRRNHSEAQ